MQKKVTQHIENDHSAIPSPAKTPKKSRTKKGFAGILVVLGVMVLLFAMAIGVLHSKSVQTYIIGKVTDRLEQILHTDVEIAQFHYRPLSHLSIDRIYLSDQLQDTLAFIEQMQVEFHPLQLRYDRIDIQQLRLQNPYLNLQSTSDSTLNIQFLIDIFKHDSNGSPFRLNIDSLALEQTRIRYNQIFVDQLNLGLSVPVVSQDSLKIHLDSMHIRAQLDGIDAYFEAHLHGDLDSISADHMQLVCRGTRLFSGNIIVHNPTKLDSLYINANCSDLYCNDVLLRDLLAELRIKQIALPKVINNLGDVHYSGTIYGQLEQLLLNGAFTTSLGTIDVNGELQSDLVLQNFNFQGNVKTSQFHIGELLANSDLGTIDIKATINGKITDSQFENCSICSQIDKIEYKGYCYQSIELQGEMSPEDVRGILTIDDENIRLNLNGVADWSPEAARFAVAAKLEDFRPTALHLIDNYPELEIDAESIYADLYTSGINAEMLDNMHGYAEVSSLLVRNGNDSTTIGQLLKVTFNNLEKERLTIESDFLTGKMTGAFRYMTLPHTIQQILHQRVPNFIEQPTPTESNDSLTFYAYFRDLGSITKVLNLDVELPETPRIQGSIEGNNNHIYVDVNIPHVITNKLDMKGLGITLTNTNKKLTLDAHVRNPLPKDATITNKLGELDIKASLSAKQDELNLTINLNGDNDSIRNEGTIRAKAKLNKYKNQPKLDITVQPEIIILNDSAWNIEKSHITYIHADKVMDISNFTLNTNYQSISANGKASELFTDSICVKLKNINLDYILSYTEANKAISIMGPATGEAQIYSVFTEPMLEAKAYIPNGGLNNVYLGDITAEATLDKENKSILINGQVVDSSQHVVAQVAGKAIPAIKWWGLDITCDSIDINFINFWTKDLISNPQGRAYGRVKVEGQNHLAWVTGRALAKNAQITVPQIGVTFHLTDSIFMDSTQIQFPNIRIYDKFGNPGLFYGTLNHTNFANFTYDLRAEANNMMVMDLPAAQQSFFYGQVFGTGDVHIHGDENDCNIDVYAKTEANTKFYLNINTASQATTSDFITFVQPNTANSTSSSDIKKPQSKMKLKIDGEVTPNADITIRLGGDDGIKGRGEGNLNLTYETPSENITMQGTYTLQSGKVDFSLGNIVRRNFTIREGSQITWNSDPLAPMLNITGHYQTNASLRDLFGSESSQVATDRNSVPVNCVLSMKDQLFNPILEFAIELPQSDESVQSQVNSLINTDEMLMRQVIYLLAFNRFYTPDYLQNTQNVGLNETYSILSSTLTGQINSWLSKLTDVFTMGFNFRTDGEGATASQEYGANFQIHPINQLVINGNFGYRYNDLSNRPFFGDLDIEYLLTDNGKVRAKAFTHTVDKYSLRQANTVQGVGFVFKHDFNWKKRQKKDSNQKNDSTQHIKKITKQQKEKQQ